MSKTKPFIAKQFTPNDFEACPHCGYDTGLFSKVQYSGTGQMNYSFDVNKDADNTELHRGVIYKEGKYLYCQECSKAVCLNTNRTY